MTVYLYIFLSILILLIYLLTGIYSCLANSSVFEPTINNLFGDELLLYCGEYII